jgi:hypothetical protein
MPDDQRVLDSLRAIEAMLKRQDKEELARIKREKNNPVPHGRTL